MAAEQSKVLTLVFTDLADSTALKSERGDVAVGELIARHRDHVVQLAERCNGRVIDWAGDGCFLTFETSSTAVMFGLRLQQVHHYEPDLPGVRIGIHVGEVTERPFDGTVRIEGLAVDLSARIGGLAAPGQVLISAPVHQSAKQRLGIHEFGQPIRWETYGPYALKGFDEPLDIREAGLQDISRFNAPAASEKAWPAKDGARGGVTERAKDIPIRKLAVLPLSNLSGDSSQEYFADGMTEAVITELAKIKALRVISRTSVMRYKNTTQSLRDIARELDVDGLIEGTVLRVGNDVRITAQFIRGDSDEHLWAEHYDGTMENVLKLQKEVALAIADAIHVTVSAGERVELRNAKTINPEAYDLYLKASRFGGAYTQASIQKSFSQIDEVERLEPGFGRIHTMRATAHFFMGMAGYGPSTQSFAASRREGRHAARLDDTDSGAHTVLGWIAMMYEWDWGEALYRFQRSMALNSSNHYTYSGLTFLHAFHGQIDDALTIAKQGIEVNPKHPTLHHNVGMMHFFRHEYDDALDMMARSASVGRRVPTPLVDGALIAACAGDCDRALVNIAEAIELDGPHPHHRAVQGYAHARAGNQADAEAILEELEQPDGGMYVLSIDRALVNLALGRTNAALSAMEHSVQEREYLAVLLTISPLFEPLHAEPRFQALVDLIGYPREKIRTA